MDELKLYTYIAVFGSFALYFGIAWWARAGSTSEFYVAGGGISPIQNGMAIGADWMSAASFISMAGLIADRYYSKTARIVAVICLIIASLTYIIGQMKGVGVAFSRFLEVDYGIGLGIGMGVV